MREDQSTFSISSTIDSIDEAVVRSVAFATSAGFGDEALFGIDMAVREAVANAVKHGNRLDESKSVEIRLSNLEEGLEISVRDFGDGFDVASVPDPTDPENLLKATGRGILFIHNFVDRVAWVSHEDGGTVVTMFKQR